MDFKLGLQEFSPNFSPSPGYFENLIFQGQALEEPQSPPPKDQKVNKFGSLKSFSLKLGVFDPLPPWIKRENLVGLTPSKPSST